MLKQVLTVPRIVAILVAVFLLGSLSLGTVLAQPQYTSPPAQAAVQSVDDDDATEAAVKGPDTDDIEAEAAVEGLDLDDVENQVEQDGEFDGEF